MRTLYLFAISHFCEKARWALDHHGLAYAPVSLAPLLHAAKARRLGFRRGALPILARGDGTALQGSSAIIDYAEAESGAPPDPAEDRVAREIEARLDAVVGPAVRRHFYSEALVERPEVVRPFFLQGLSRAERLAVRLMWPALRRAMIRHLDLGPAQRVAARDAIAAELDRLDALFSDGRRYLAGARFGRADIAAASLLSPVAQPPEHPTYGGLATPPKVADDYAQWAERPSIAWVRAVYAAHRWPRTGARA